MNAIFLKEYKRMMAEVISPEDNYIEKFVTLRNLVNSEMPKKLFRFRTCQNYSLDAFLSDEIYHSKPEQFNDPHDCLVYINMNYLLEKIDKELTMNNLRNIMSQISDEKKRPEYFSLSNFTLFPEMQIIIKGLEKTSAKGELLKNEADNSLSHFRTKAIKNLQCIEETMHKHFRTYPKIACFSKNITSTLMWAHYADYHKGFALEYDFTQVQSLCLNCKDQCELGSSIKVGC